LYSLICNWELGIECVSKMMKVNRRRKNLLPIQKHL
jgi:hypothetical protein